MAKSKRNKPNNKKQTPKQVNDLNSKQEMSETSSHPDEYDTVKSMPDEKKFFSISSRAKEGLLGTNETAYKIVSSGTSWLFFLAGLIFMIIMHYYFFAFTQDDAYITLRYSRNLYNGAGLVWNDPELYPEYNDINDSKMQEIASRTNNEGVYVLFDEMRSWYDQREYIEDIEHVEGFTNFTFVLLGALGVWMEERFSDQAEDPLESGFKDTNGQMIHYNKMYQEFEDTHRNWQADYDYYRDNYNNWCYYKAGEIKKILSSSDFMEKYFGVVCDDSPVQSGQKSITSVTNNLCNPTADTDGPLMRLDPPNEPYNPLPTVAMGNFWVNFPIKFLKFISMLSLIGIYIFTYLFSARVVKIQTVEFRIIPGLFVATGATLILWSASGLEIAFFILFLVMSFYYLMRALDDGPKWYYILSAVSLIIAQMSRPEALLFFAASMALFGLRFLKAYLGKSASADNKQIEKDNLKYYLIFALIFIGFVIIYYSWKSVYFGDALPNTFRVKSQGGWYAVQKGFSYIGELITFNGVIIMLFLLVLGVIYNITDKKLPDYTLYILIIVFGYLAYMIKIGGDILPQYRLFAPGYVFLALMMAPVINRQSMHTNKFIWDYIYPEKHRIFRNGVFLIFFLIALLINGYKVEQVIKQNNQGFMGVENALTNCHREVIKWFHDNQIPAGTKIVGQDMGVIPYESMNYIHIDTIGLCDKTIAHNLYDYSYSPYLSTYWDENYVREIEIMKEDNTKYLMQRDPEYVFIHIHYDYNDEKQKEDIETLRSLMNRFPEDYTEEVDPLLIQETHNFIWPKIYAAGFYYHYTSMNNGNWFNQNHVLRRIFRFSDAYLICVYQKIT